MSCEGKMHLSRLVVLLCPPFMWWILTKPSPPSSTAMFSRSIVGMYCLLLYVHYVSLVCMGVFVYVCIWFTHQSFGVMSLTCWGAQRAEATVRVWCVSTHCRSLMSLWVRCQGVGVKTGRASETLAARWELWDGDNHNLSQDWVHPRVMPRRDGVCKLYGVPRQTVFKQGRRKWRLIQKTTETWADCTHPTWVAIRRSAVKINILCCKLALAPSGSLIPTFNTCISSSHCGQSDHMLWAVITAKCLQSSHINTRVKQHGVPSWTRFFCFCWKCTKSGFRLTPPTWWHLPNIPRKWNINGGESPFQPHYFIAFIGQTTGL